jgi:hypothetical protein
MVTNNTRRSGMKETKQNMKINSTIEKFYYFENPDDPELRKAWDNFPEGIDPRVPCFCCKEYWQYMGSQKHNGEWVHNFRHRHYLCKDRKYIEVDASPDWEPKDDYMPK